MNVKAPKGVFDIYPNAQTPWQDSSIWYYVERVAREFCATFNFKEIRTPIFEHLELFHKGVGEGSDIVSKEMYQFTDRGGRELALRPEGTAAMIRAYLENNLYALEKTSKLFYIAPMFRYERQQSGRYRQHHQFGAEALGVSSPFQDVEMIELLLKFYHSLGITHTKLLINCVGSFESRQAYCRALKEFLEPHFEDLSQDSKTRFHKNMLRILDSKDPHDQKLLVGCPDILDYLDEHKKAHFETVLSTLTQLKIPYTIEPKLVRGLDYYDSTVFEVLSTQGPSSLTLGGGGRYDGLITSYGGQPTPAVGFGTGLERVIQTLLAQTTTPVCKPHLDVYIIPLDESLKQEAYLIAHQLREAHFSCDVELSGRKLKNALPFASCQGAKFALMLGEQERAENKLKVKNLSTREETLLDQNSLISYLSNQS
jgi:histidyl-tRNA synthetase